MHPVFHGSVIHAFVECICGQDQDEVTCPLYTLNQFVLKFTGLQLLHIYKDAVSSNLQVHLQKAWNREESEKVSKNVAQVRLNKTFQSSVLAPVSSDLASWEPVVRR